MSAALIDRELQRKLLEHLAERFPKGRAVEMPIDAHARDVNLAYLEQHGLVEHRFAHFSGGSPSIDLGWSITADGIDFLRDDGGLSAILGVVTIRLHDDTIKALIESRIIASSLPQPEKQRYLDRLRSLPADATKHLVLKLIEKGLDNAPDALPWLQTMLNQAGG